MSNSVYLHRDDLDTILNIMDRFYEPEDRQVVEIEYDTSSGIGAVVKVHLHGVDFNGLKVTVSKVIVDENDW